MQTAACSNPLKRQRSDQHPSKLEEASQPISKKRKTICEVLPEQQTLHRDSAPRRAPAPQARDALRKPNAKKAPTKRESSRTQQLRRPAGRPRVTECKESCRPRIRADIIEICGRDSYNEVKRFARHGGPDLQDLRGCYVHSRVDQMDSSQGNTLSRSQSRRSTGTKPTTEGSSTKGISPHNRAFQQCLIDAKIYPRGYEYADGHTAPKPGNWDEINRRLSLPRSSLSPSKFSDRDFEKFVRANDSAAKENQVRENVIPIIRGEIKDPRNFSGGLPFTNLAPISDDNLASAVPDFYYGSRPELVNRQIRNELAHLIAPSTQTDLPILPNHFTAVKGPDGMQAVAGRQASYDGSLGVRGVNALISYGHEEPQFDGNAHTISTIYNNGHLQLYTSYATAPATPEDRPAYHIQPLRSYSMIDTKKTFIEGASAYRNTITWAQEERERLIEEANERLRQISAAAASDPNALGINAASFVSTVPNENSEEEDDYTMESQVSTTRSFVEEDYVTATSSQEAGSTSVPVTRPTRHRGRAESRRKRQNQGNTEDASRVTPHASSSGTSNRSGKKKRIMG